MSCNTCRSKNTDTVVGSRLIKKILDLIQTNTKGELDGNAFESVSMKASGARFIIKGWKSSTKGPAIRFCAPWGDLANGYVLYQETPKSEWQDVDQTSIDLDFNWDIAVLLLKFNTEDGSKHECVFYGLNG